jgi:hypothetical protein
VSGDKRAWSAETFFRKLVTHGRGKEESEEDALSRPAKGTLELGDIQGFIVRGYRMPMVRHFVLTVGVAAKARELLGRLVSGDESDAPQITTSLQDQETTSPMSHVASPTTALTWASPGPGWSRWR